MDKEVIRISINSDEKILELLRRMLTTKETEHSEVECELNGQVLTTEGCITIQDMVIKNNDAIFQEFENDRTALIEAPEVQEIVETFASRENQVEDLAFNNKLNELDSLDFTSSVQVYNWLNSIVEYINNPEATIALSEDKKDYITVSNYIVRKLEEKGYTSEKQPINNINDYYRRLISYQVSDLDKYQFFAYDYADKLKEENKLNITSNTVEEEKIEQPEESEELIKLEEQRQKILRKLELIDEYEKGMFNVNREKKLSFDERKKNIQARIDELEASKKDMQVPNINEEFTTANDRVISIATRTGKGHLEAMRYYEAAAGIPFHNNIIPALEKAAALPDNEEIKQPLIDAITKLIVRYSSLQDQQDADLIKETMEKLGITPYSTTSVIDNEIAELQKEIQKIDDEQQKRIEIEKPVREELNKELQQIEQQIEEIKNPVNPVQESTETVNEENFIDKLSSIAEEGPIFVDTERRLNSEQQWLTADNAINLGKIDTENENQVAEPIESNVQSELEVTEQEPEVAVEPVETEIATEDIDDFVAKEDSLTIPHPIKAIKKASIKLIEKVKSIEFTQKTKDALSWIKDNKKRGLAVATGLMIGGFAMLGTQLNNAEETTSNVVSAAPYMEAPTINTSEEVVEENTQAPVVEEAPIVTETKTDAEIAETAIQDTLNGVLEGDSVYTNALDAANDENAKTTSERQRETSWSTSEAGAFYDESAKVLTRDEAEAKIADGEQVVVRYDNKGVPIGYVSVGQQLNDNTGLSK